jgi:hypothetical protein
MLEKGHYDVQVTRPSVEKIACWIDLLVPFCGDYRKAAAWTPEERAEVRAVSEEAALRWNGAM